ncbi:CwfJ C-terminus 1-domain-containing protein-like protein [Chaetomidium leptoderma]|uniref:CwfJ C-terminus 1-domain-containing protein-like protein n=1 Tax=Chaetomidium leptoderma TaxID=669021 RepID=A0AAN6VGG1_9PEZI|nr:CwfJ C-terminus 1-domain-containing protein-like protein [Chaetomidium leptoderma]
MDSLDDFEKALAAEKAERDRTAQDKEERRERKHKHHHRRERSSERDRTSDRHRHRERDRREDGQKDRDGERGRDGRHRPRDDDVDEDRHRHKRSRHSRDDGDEESGHRHRQRRSSRDQGDNRHERRGTKDTKDLKLSDPKEDLPLPDEEMTPAGATPLVRDSWMTAPSALDIDYVHRGAKRKSPSPVREEPPKILHTRELNRGLNDVDTQEDGPPEPVAREVNYRFGDEGSQWRMTKLKAVYTISEQTGRPVDEVAEERFGNLRDFDAAREEETEMDRRWVYGEGYVGKEKPTGELYAERMANTRPEPTRSPSPQPEQGVVIEDMIQPAPPMDQSALNRMRAQLMKAKLRNAPEAAKLETEYNAAMAAFSTSAASNNAVVLDASHNRMLAGSRGEVKALTTKRGVERGQVEANEDMSIGDMVREERRTRGQTGGEGLRLAERIAKDARFDNDLEYLDENAAKLAKRVHKTDVSLKNIAVTEYKKLNRILDTCPLCFHEDRNPPQDQPLAPVLALATRTYLTLPTQPELTGAEGGAVIVPLSHRTNLLECDDDEWEELRNFMKSLTRLYHEQGREVLFYENAAAPHRRPHAALVAVPIPYDLGDTAPAFFREAMLSADEEWAQHKKVIDTGKKAREGGLGKMAFRRSLAKEMPYFHAWFTLDGGLGHVVEDAERWPKGDLFAREIIGGMLDTEPDVIKRQGRWTRNDERVDGFKKRWRKFDWTRVLAEGG